VSHIVNVLIVVIKYAHMHIITAKYKYLYLAVIMCMSKENKKTLFTVKNIFKICYHNIFSFVKSTL